MRLVYSKARCVCIWLDYELDRDSQVYDQFLRLGPKSDDFTILERVNFWDPLCRIFKHEYFKRIWVQQQMSNAVRLSLQCRNTILPSACLVSFIHAWRKFLYMHYDNDMPLPKGSSFRENPNSKFYSKIVGERTTYGDHAMDLMEVLCQSRELTCTDKRDVVYGLMFLSHGWRQSDLIADYTLPISEVYRQAMVSCFTVYETLSFLEHANFSYDGYEAILDRTPSWVPDFRKKTQHLPTRNHWLRQDKEYPLRQDYSQLARFSGNLLYTYGVKVADVERCFDFWSHKYGHLNVSVHKFAQSFNLIIEEARAPPTRKDRTRRLVWLLTQAASATQEGLEDEKFVEAADFFACFFRPSPPDNQIEGETSITLNQLRWGCSRENDLEEVDNEGMQRDEVEDLFSTISVLLMKLCTIEAQRAAPFISAAGLIGLASLEMRTGDEIWLIPTCSGPIVLRLEDGKYLVLGRAWYDDDMTWNRFLGSFDLESNETLVNKRIEICLK